MITDLAFPCIHNLVISYAKVIIPTTSAMILIMGTLLIHTCTLSYIITNPLGLSFLPKNGHII